MFIIQTYDRQYNPNLTYTVFEDEFAGISIDTDKWRLNENFRGTGQLIYSLTTHNVSNGKLELSMLYYPNYNEYADYVGSEFQTNKTFLYGIFKCEASFANGVGSWPAFWFLQKN